ncbi:MAG: alpha/beta hydrolase [Polyangia bacterium]
MGGSTARPLGSAAETFTALGGDGVELHCERVGSGPPLLLSDGLLCEGHVWKYLVPELFSDWECLHWHYPGHGESAEPPPWSELSPERLADDAAAVAESAGAESLVAVGHSLGVQVSLELWHRHPELVRALILVCGAPGRIVESFHQSALLEHLIPLLGVAARFLPEQTSTLWRKIPFGALMRPALLTGEVNPRLVRTRDLADYFARLGRVDFRVALSLLESFGRHDATPYLERIDVPTLVVAGAEDSFTPPARSSEMAREIPGAELMLVPGGTHSLPIERPELVNLRIERFLNERLPSTNRPPR